MRSLVKALVSAAAFVSMSSLVSAQNGFSVSDTTPFQTLIRFSVTSGAATNLGPINTNTEQEGLFSTGSLLFGYSENDPALATPDQRNPGTRILPTPAAAFAPNLVNQPFPNGNLRVCAADGAAFGTESGAAYNPVDGFVYVVNSDDTITFGNTRSRFFRFRPGCNGFQELGSGSTLYVDGVAVDGAGNIFMSSLRNAQGSGVTAGQVYLFDPGSGSLFALPQPVGIAGINEDSGLAWDFSNDRLYGLGELGRVFQINPATGAVVPGTIRTVTLPGGAVPIELEGFDIPVADPGP